MVAETFPFSADISQLLSIIINTFYANKEIFLRELISNASDALDKVRYGAITDSTAMGGRSKLEIKLRVDKENNTLTITDTGIGMTKEELINNLGTIAKSGTKAFMEALQGGADLSMIGQFGVGFYSAYLVADKVLVRSRTNGHDAWQWQSDAGGAFTVQQGEADALYGTTVVLYIKPEHLEYLEETRLRSLVALHSSFVGFPISLLVEKTTEKEITDDEESAGEEEAGEGVPSVVEEKAESATQVDRKKKKTVKEVTQEWEQLNTEKPIWTLPPKEVSHDQYATFYKNLSQDWEEHLAVQHFSVEGKFQFKGLFFIPKRKPFGMFQQLNRKKKNVKLYVRRVFVTDTFEDMVPEYLRFVQGIVDSDDLPLNISREILQQNKVVEVIKKHVVKKILEMFSELSGEDFLTFYGNYSKSIKLGVYQDKPNRDKLVELLRFQSNKSDGKLISLKDYVSRMADKQESIYFVAGESLEHVADSPFLERLSQKGLECLYMTDAIDEYVMEQLRDYQGKKLVSVAREGLALEGDDEEKHEFEEAKKRLLPLCKKIKDVLADGVEKVVVSSRVVDSPCCLVAGEHGWSANMERIAKAQTLDDNNPMGHRSSRKTMELNPKHPIITALQERVEADDKDTGVGDLIHLLYDVALVSSGFTIKKPSTFAKAIHGLISLGLSLQVEDSDSEPESAASPVAADVPPVTADVPPVAEEAAAACEEHIEVPAAASSSGTPTSADYEVMEEVD